jgi:hypothetical protein
MEFRDLAVSVWIQVRDNKSLQVGDKVRESSRKRTENHREGWAWVKMEVLPRLANSLSS